MPPPRREGLDVRPRSCRVTRGNAPRSRRFGAQAVEERVRHPLARRLIERLERVQGALQFNIALGTHLQRGVVGVREPAETQVFQVLVVWTEHTAAPKLL